MPESKQPDLDRSVNKPINRRNFIKTTASAGTAFVFAPMIMTKARANDSNDLNIALLGAGAQGQVLMNATLKIPNIRFKAVCDIWEDYNLKRAYRLLKKFGHELNAYEDFQEMFSKTIQFIFSQVNDSKFLT